MMSQFADKDDLIKHLIQERDALGEREVGFKHSEAVDKITIQDLEQCLASTTEQLRLCNIDQLECEQRFAAEQQAHAVTKQILKTGMDDLQERLANCEKERDALRERICISTQ